MNNKLMSALVLLGTFLINIELTAVNLALPQIAKQFTIEISTTSSILSLYLAFFAVFAVIGGKLGDIWGRTKVIIFMLVIFLSAAIIGGSAEKYYWLLLSRVLQGLSAGAMLPNYTALLYDNTLKKRHAIGLISAIVGFATSTGPLIGSLITTYMGWRYIFFLNVPIVIAIMLGLICFSFKEKHISSVQRIDIKGMLLTIVLILLIMKLIELLPTLKVITIGLLLLTLILCFYYWLKHHINSNNPFLFLKLFQFKTFTVGCVLRMLLGFAYYIILYILGTLSQEVLHLNMALSGTIYLPMTLAVTIASMLYNKITNTIKLSKLLPLGLLGYLTGTIIFAYSLNNFMLVIISLILIGIAYGILYSVLFTLTLQNVKSNNTSEASGMLYFFNLLGGTLGVSIAGILLIIKKQSSLISTIAVGAHTMLLICSGMVMICFILSLTINLRNV